MHSLLDLKLASTLNDDRLADAAAQGKRAAVLAARPGRRNRPATSGTETEQSR